MVPKKSSAYVSIIFLLGLFLAACSRDSSQNEAEPEPAATANTAELPIVAADGNDSPETVDAMQTFVIVPAESRASYLASEEFFEDALSKYGIDVGLNDVVGSTQAVKGQLQLNPDTLELGENTFEVDLSTLESDQDRRDSWIRGNGPAFSRFPRAIFTANALAGLPDSYNEGDEVQFQVAGDLTVREVSLPVTFDARATLEGDTISGTLSTSVLMSDFGIEPPSFARTLTVEDEFGIQVEFTAVKQAE